MAKRPASEAWERLKDIASDLFDEEDEGPREKFLHDGMEKMGYKKRTEWDDADDENGSNKSSGNMFGGPRAAKNREERRASGGMYG